MFKITQNKMGEYLFSLYAGNGQEILYSEPYMTKAGCENAIESTRRNSLREDAFQKKKDYFQRKVLLLVKSTKRTNNWNK